MRWWVLALLLTLPGLVWAQPTLYDLDVPSTRIPNWYDVMLPSTASWSIIDVTDAPYGAVCNGIADDRTAIQTAIDNAAAKTIILLPAGTCRITNSLMLRKSEIVLRGQGSTSTTIRGDGEFTNTGPGGFPNTCPLRSLVHIGGIAPSTNVSWTAGYVRGNTALSVSDTTPFSINDYVQTKMPNDPSLLDNPDGTGDIFSPIARVASVAAGTITLDRPLRHDFNTVGGQVVRQFAEIRNVGIEDVDFQHTNQTTLHDSICFRFAVESWVSNIRSGFEFATAPNSRHISIYEAARVRIQNSYFGHLTDPTSPSNYHLWLGRYLSTENVVVNNIFEHYHNGVVIQGGASGNVVAYNYFLNGQTSNRPIFLHGTYPYENLIEGNDVTGNIEMDNYWGRQGPRNTLMRNRVRGSSSSSLIAAEGVGTYFFGDLLNVILNHAFGYIARVGCSYDGGNCFPFDQHSPPSGPQQTNIWLEANMWRDTRTPGNYGLILKPLASTRCGTSSGPGDCTGGNQIQEGDNYEGIGSLTTGNSYPYSLVEGWNTANAPSWWCNETAWPAIGADVDNFGGLLTKIPAQRRHEALSCTTNGPIGTVDECRLVNATGLDTDLATLSNGVRLTVDDVSCLAVQCTGSNVGSLALVVDAVERVENGTEGCSAGGLTNCLCDTKIYRGLRDVAVTPYSLPNKGGTPGTTVDVDFNLVPRPRGGFR